MSETKKDGANGGFSGMMEDLKEKFHDSKLHDAKVGLIHKKSAELQSIHHSSVLLTHFTDIRLVNLPTW